MNECYVCVDCGNDFDLESVDDEHAQDIRQGIIEPTCEPCRQRQILLKLPRLIKELKEKGY